MFEIEGNGDSQVHVDLPAWLCCNCFSFESLRTLRCYFMVAHV